MNITTATTGTNTATDTTMSARSVLAYNPKSSKANPGEVLIKITYKTVTDKSSRWYNIKRDSQCVSVPKIPEAEIQQQITVLMPYISDMLVAVQSKIIREALDADAKSIGLDTISLAACIEYMESSDDSGRLTKEAVNQWFDEVVLAPLCLAIAEKMQGVDVENMTTKQAEHIGTITDHFKSLFASLAGGKTAYQVKVCEQLLKALALVDDSDLLKHRFTARLEKMIAESSKAVNFLDSL